MNVEKGIRFALNIFRKILGKAFDTSRFEAAYIKAVEKDELVMLKSPKGGKEINANPARQL